MKTRTGLQLRGGGTLPEENGGTGSTDLEDVAVGSAGSLIVDDTRSVNSPPSYYYDRGAKVISEFKNCSTVGLPSDETYCTVVTVCPWTDDSGGAVTQTAYVGKKMYIRQSADDSTWGGWESFTPFKQITPYTADNGWTRIERFSSFPPQRKDLAGNPSPVPLYLIAAIPSSYVGGPDHDHMTNSPVLVYGGFSYIDSPGGAEQKQIFLPYSTQGGYILVDTYFLGIEAANTGIGSRAVYINTQYGSMNKLSDEDLDKISYVYKELIV